MPRKAKALWGFFFAAGLRAARLRRVKFMPTVAQRLWGLFLLVGPSVPLRAFGAAARSPGDDFGERLPTRFALP